MRRELKSWTDALDRYLLWMATLTHPPDSFLQDLGEDAVRLRHRALHTAPSLLTLASGALTPADGLLARRGTPQLRPEGATRLDRGAGQYAPAKRQAAETHQGLPPLAKD